jgi:hypothetical protein
LARTSGDSACSWSKGPPGASRMMKNDSVTSTNNVGTSPTMRRSV